MNVSRKLLAAAVLAALSSPAFAEVEFDVIGGSEVSFEGLLQADYYRYDVDVANLDSGAKDGDDSDSGMRRAELVFKGKGPGMWNWVVGYDAFSKKWLDTNVSYKFTGNTSAVFGQYKQPISLEELSSTGKNDFISKAMTTNLYAVSRRVGLGATTGGESWTLTGSVFGRELTRSNGQGNGFGARFTFAPMHESGNILHLGVAAVDYKAQDPLADGRVQVRVRPDADMSGKRLVDSGLFTDADRIRTVGLEGAWVHGPFKLQGEYMTSTIGREAHADFKSDSWYVSGVWTVTGETWGYKNGVITTGLPSEPARGMWQVAARYDHADLNDGDFTAPSTVTGVLGGKESNWTLGVNWSWRSNFKFAANYVKVSSERYNATSHAFVQDDPSIVEFRAQVYW